MGSWRLFQLFGGLLLLCVACSSGSSAVAPGTGEPPSSTEAVSPESVPTLPPDTLPSEIIPPETVPPDTPATTLPLVETGEPGGFDDHAARQIRTLGEFEALAARDETGKAVAKFIIPDLLGDDPELADEIYWLDSNFYALHDEWVFFRLLNGQRVPGFAQSPLDEGSFDTIEEIYDHFEGVADSDLPGVLEWTPRSRPGERLYVGEFYAQALRFVNDDDAYGNYEERSFGTGSIVRTAPNELSGERWLMELQFTESVTPEELSRYFAAVTASVPDEIAESLEWIVRSAEQEEVAREIQAQDFAFADRIVRYGEIVPPGEVEVYNEGIAAGRLLLVEEGGKQLSDAGDQDIVLIERVPDFLPPANALITSDPQTPLAHVNLLARNRGIPNASQSGLLDDEGLRRNALARAPVVVRTLADGTLDIEVIRQDDYRAWLQLIEQEPIEVPPIPAGPIESVIDLTELAARIDDQRDIDGLLPTIGGKAGGFLTLLTAEGVTAPPEPVVITTPMYEQHLDLVRPALDEMLDIDGFDLRANTWLRVLLLEGRETFDDVYSSPVDQGFAADFIDDPENEGMVDVIEAGGFARYFRDAPMDRSSLDDITTSLEAAFGEYAVQQGLRFRSSSSVEDIEGFSGAGLYDSNTGFLDASAQDEDDQKRTIERSLKKTWASYWGLEAYEERRRENVDHESGGMAVLVHARFDDDLELANGVATFQINPPSGPDADLSVATINVQKGAVSVANPDPSDPVLPEIHEVRVATDRSEATELLASSTLSPDTAVLSSADLNDLHAQMQAVATLWLERVNAALPPAQKVSTLTLDFEFKVMAQGWPQRTTGNAEPRRVVVKQARSLDPGLRAFDQAVLDLAVPRDVLARASRVVEVSCPDGNHIDVFTSPFLLPDIGYGDEPFSTSPDRSDDGCSTQVLFSDADEFLVDLLANAEGS